MRAVATVGYCDKAALRDALLLTIAKTQEEKAALGEDLRHLLQEPEPRNLEDAPRTPSRTIGKSVRHR